MIQTLVFSANRSSASYEIERGSLNSPRSLVQCLTSLGSRCAIITDETVASLYGINLFQSLCDYGIEAFLFSFPSGECYKTRSTKDLLEDQMLQQGLGRDTCVIALGGGVVTDIAGYIAATYCRGISLVMIPTSLLGMVDASIGGKTGINTPYGKNMLGCIYQPNKVLIDPSVLRTLPLKEFRNGMVEMIKYGLIADRHFFDYLEQHSDKLLALDSEALEKSIFESCRIKKEIVEEDEKEKGKRHLLNFGHTVGHALEQVTHYSISHGEAVAIGLLVESYLAVQLGYLSHHSFSQIHSILVKYALPLQLPIPLSVQMMLDAMTMDKKSLKGIPRFVLIDEIGSPRNCNLAYCTHVEETFIKNALHWMIDDLCRH